MQKCAKVQEELSKWDIRLDTAMQKIQGRSLKPEQIIQANNKKNSYPVDNADWGTQLRNFK